MKFFLLFVALVGFVSAEDDADLVVLKKFLTCVDKALDEGIPSFPLPKHDPLIVDDIVFSGGSDVLSYKVGLTDNVVVGLLNYTLPVLNDTVYHTPEMVAFSYQVYWPAVRISGNWEIDVKVPFVDNDQKGTYDIVLNHIDWWGIFNLTKAGQEAQGYPNEVNAFTLESSTVSVDVNVTGTVGDGVVDETLKVALLALMNNFPAQAAELVRTERFNKFWIQEPGKLQELLDFCGWE